MANTLGSGTLGSGTLGYPDGVVSQPSAVSQLPIVHPIVQALPPAYWKMVHYDHAGNALGECFPSNLSFTIELDNIGVISYDIDISHSLCNDNSTYPFLTDWILQQGNTSLMGGEHTGVAINDIEGHNFSINGKSWGNYFDTRWYPFDPSFATPQGYYAPANADIFTIVETLFNAAMAQNNSLIVTYPDGTNGFSGQTIPGYKIDPGDTESLFSKLKNLSQIKPGFDFEFTYDKQLKLYAPQKSMLRDIVFEQGRNCYGIDYTNNGVKGTHTMGLGSGVSSKLGVAIDGTTITSYRRRDVSNDFQSVSDIAMLTSLTQAEADRNQIPAIQFGIKYIPDASTDIFAEISVGDTARVVIDFGWTKIDQYMRLITIQGSPNDEGDTELLLTWDDQSVSI